VRRDTRPLGKAEEDSADKSHSDTSFDVLIVFSLASNALNPIHLRITDRQSRPKINIHQ
jgi:hypothetical protein